MPEPMQTKAIAPSFTGGPHMASLVVKNSVNRAAVVISIKAKANSRCLAELRPTLAVAEVIKPESVSPCRHASSIIDLNRGSHTGRKDDVRRHLVDLDANRNALGEAHPGEDRVNGSDALFVGLRI